MLCCMVRSTPRAMALGARIRDARTKAGLSQRGLDAKLELGVGSTTRIESGERPPDAQLTSRILGALDVNGDAYDEIMALAREDGPDGPAWLAIGLPEQQAQLDALVGFEQLATEIVDVSMLIVPGLCQVGSYTRAIMRASNTPPEEIPRRVVTRLGRAEILTRKNSPVNFTAFIGEGALRGKIGDEEVMSEQREHLVKLAQLPNVEILVVELDVDWHPGLDGPSMLLTIKDATTVVYLENRLSGLFLQGEEEVKAYTEAVAQLRHVAMSPTRSVEFIKSVS